ncbi:hypothetical protein Y032_0002g976 [Ancylostoma ceylanicum]|uniref:Uncharacterized protein n=1 Tax=Ancylostoma ceylanicum TaxID=53326 RepID=A0A016W433_9BILA|nr:hypothetical protein Y032_0002g976 [Ancylostoma ceylanicum]
MSTSKGSNDISPWSRYGLFRDYHTTIRHILALLQFNIGKRDLCCPMEQMWLKLPHDEYQCVRQEQNMCEIMSEPQSHSYREPQYILRSQLRRRKDHDSSVDPYRDGVWSFAEDENASFSSLPPVSPLPHHADNEA